MTPTAKPVRIITPERRRAIFNIVMIAAWCVQAALVALILYLAFTS